MVVCSPGASGRLVAGASDETCAGQVVAARRATSRMGTRGGRGHLFPVSFLCSAKVGSSNGYGCHCPAEEGAMCAESWCASYFSDGGMRGGNDTAAQAYICPLI